MANSTEFVQTPPGIRVLGLQINQLLQMRPGNIFLVQAARQHAGTVQREFSIRELRLLVATCVVQRLQIATERLGVMSGTADIPL